MSILCRLFGHKWRELRTEDCPEIYRVCERCNRVRHVCNEIDWRDESDISPDPKEAA